MAQQLYTARSAGPIENGLNSCCTSGARIDVKNVAGDTPVDWSRRRVGLSFAADQDRRIFVILENAMLKGNKSY